MKRLTGLAALALVASGFLVAAVSVVFALDATPSTAKPFNRSLPTVASKSGQSPLRANVRACQVKENAVKQRSLHLIRLANNMEIRFDTIANRVETFATASGKTIPNYNALVADIAAKKALVSAALVKTSADVTDFNCTGNDPKGQLVQFRLDMQSVMGALKNYRVSIKNLIVAVRSVVGQEAKNE